MSDHFTETTTSYCRKAKMLITRSTLNLMHSSECWSQHSWPRRWRYATWIAARPASRRPTRATA